MERNLQEIDDEALVKYFQNTHSPIYFQEIYHRYAAKVFQQCLTYLKDTVAAKDLCQDAFIKIYEKASNYNFKARFSTWVFRVVRNLCIDYLKKENRFSEFVDGKKKDEDDYEFWMSDEDIFSVEIKKLRLAMEHLAERDREIILLKYGYEWQISEISEITDLTEAAVKMRLKRAKAKLSLFLKKKVN